MRHPLLDALDFAWPRDDWAAHPVVVACSGGPDSVALAAALAELAAADEASAESSLRNLSLAYVHHGLRAEADRDAEVVTRLAERLGIESEIVRISLPEGTARGEGTEGLARKLRYEALRQVARKRGARYLVTAHHAEDQAETVLFRILRGSGESGVAGIARQRRLGPFVTLIRPCLSIARRTLRDFADQRGLEFVADAMNDDPTYLRSRIRKELLPLLEERFFPDAAAALCRLADDSAERREFVERKAGEYLDRHATCAGGAIAVDFGPALAEGPFFVREIVRLLWMRNGWPRQNMSRARWLELGSLVASDDAGEAAPAVVFPGGVRVTPEAASIWRFEAPPTARALRDARPSLPRDFEANAT